WLSKSDAGLQRLGRAEMTPSPFRSSAAHARDFYSLEGGVGQRLLRDRDDNIWVGGLSGLDRFEHADLVPALSAAKVGEWFNCVDTGGGVWVGNANGELFALKDGRVREVDRAEGAYNLYCGADGRVYFLHDSGITVFRDGQVRRLPLLPGFGGHGDHYIVLGLDDETDGSVIASVGGAAVHGLFRYEAGRWSPWRSDLALPEVLALLNVPDLGLYLAFTGDVDRVGTVRTNALEML